MKLGACLFYPPTWNTGAETAYTPPAPRRWTRFCFLKWLESKSLLETHRCERVCPICEIRKTLPVGQACRHRFLHRIRNGEDHGINQFSRRIVGLWRSVSGSNAHVGHTIDYPLAAA